MTTKFCTTCQTTQPVLGGEVRKSKVTRWICKHCVDKKNISPYQKKQKEGRAAWL